MSTQIRNILQYIPNGIYKSTIEAKFKRLNHFMQ